MGELEQMPQASSESKGFYAGEQKRIENYRKDPRYENDEAFRRAIDTKALINEVVYMNDFSVDVSDDNVHKLRGAILEFETAHNFKSNGIVVRLDDILSAKKPERREIVSRLHTYLSGVNEGIDVALGEKSNRVEN